MKKPLMILGGQILLIALLLWIDHSRQTSQYQVLPLVPQAQWENAQGLILQKGADRIALKRKDSTWVVASSGWPVRAERIKDLWRDLQNIRKRETLSNDTSKDMEFGLDSAQVARVGLVKGQDTLWIDLGKPDPNYNGQFVRLHGESAVYKSGGVVWIDAKSAGWEDPRLFPDGDDSWFLQAERLQVQWQDSGKTYGYELVQEGTPLKAQWRWKNAQGKSDSVPVMMAQELMSKALRLEGETAVVPSDSAAFVAKKLDVIVTANGLGTRQITSTRQEGEDYIVVHPDARRSHQWVKIRSWHVKPLFKREWASEVNP